MDALLFSINAILPIVLLLGLGFFLGRSGMIRQQLIDDSTRLIFHVAIPVMLFLDMMEGDIRSSFDPRLMAFGVGSFLLLVALLWLLFPRFVKEKALAATCIQGSFRGNLIILGVPVIESVCGSAGVARLTMLAAVIGPLYSIIAVLLFTRMAGGEHPLQGKAMLGMIIKNPIVLGCAAGIIGSLLHLNQLLPLPVMTALEKLSAMVLPLSLLVQGAGIRFQGQGRAVGLGLISALLKTLVAPLLMLGLAWLLGFRGVDLAVTMILFGAPASVSSFAMAHQMGGDGRLASLIIVFSNVICMGTIFCFVLALRLLGQI